MAVENTSFMFCIKPMLTGAFQVVIEVERFLQGSRDLSNTVEPFLDGLLGGEYNRLLPFLRRHIDSSVFWIDWSSLCLLHLNHQLLWILYPTFLFRVLYELFVVPSRFHRKRRGPVEARMLDKYQP